MVILCPNCTARFRIDASGIKLPKFKVRCPKCGDGIVVENPPELEIPVSLEEDDTGGGAAPGADADSAPGAPGMESSEDESLAGFAAERPTDRVNDQDESDTSRLGGWSDDEPATAELEAAMADSAEASPPVAAAGENLRIARRSTAPDRNEAAPEERAREVRDTVDSVREELLTRFDEMMKLNYFEVLSITNESSPEDIKAAYFRLAKKYHPDRYVAHFSDEEMRRLREVSSRLNLAFNELRDPDRHRQYVLKITQPERYEKQQSANRVMEAMMQYEKGKVLFNKQNFGESLKCFEWAVELHPTEAEYHYMVGQACRRSSEGVKPDYERILAALEKAVEIQPQTVKYHLGLGYYWKQRAEERKAMRYFKNAKELDPKNHEANREIRLYLDRKRKADESGTPGGKLKKLFGSAKK